MKPWDDEPDDPESVGERIVILLMGALVAVSCLVALFSLFPSIGQ